MNGQNAFMNSSVGLTTQSAVVSGRSSAIVFGASSPSTMCSAVMMAKAIATAMLCAVASAIVAGRNAKTGSIERGQRRLADPAEADARHRDAELRRGDVAVGIGDRAPHGPRAPVAFGDRADRCASCGPSRSRTRPRRRSRWRTPAPARRHEAPARCSAERMLHQWHSDSDADVATLSGLKRSARRRSCR